MTEKQLRTYLLDAMKHEEDRLRQQASEALNQVKGIQMCRMKLESLEAEMERHNQAEEKRNANAIKEGQAEPLQN